MNDPSSTSRRATSAREADEREVGYGQTERPAHRRDVDADDVGLLEDGNAGVVAQPPVELVRPDVDGAHPLRAMLQQAIGEPARRCAQIDAGKACGVERERLERGCELAASPAHEAEAVLVLLDLELLQYLAGFCGIVPKVGCRGLALKLLDRFLRFFDLKSRAEVDYFFLHVKKRSLCFIKFYTQFTVSSKKLIKRLYICAGASFIQ